MKAQSCYLLATSDGFKKMVLAHFLFFIDTAGAPKERRGNNKKDGRMDLFGVQWLFSFIFTHLPPGRDESESGMC